MSTEPLLERSWEDLPSQQSVSGLMLSPSFASDALAAFQKNNVEEMWNLLELGITSPCGCTMELVLEELSIAGLYDWKSNPSFTDALPKLEQLSALSRRLLERNPRADGLLWTAKLEAAKAALYCATEEPVRALESVAYVESLLNRPVFQHALPPWWSWALVNVKLGALTHAGERREAVELARAAAAAAKREPIREVSIDHLRAMGRNARIHNAGDLALWLYDHACVLYQGRGFEQKAVETNILKAHVLARGEGRAVLQVARDYYERNSTTSGSWIIQILSLLLEK